MVQIMEFRPERSQYAYTFGGVAPDLDRHCARAVASARVLGLEPPVDGRRVMGHLGCGPGPVVGEALAFLREAILDQGPLDEGPALPLLGTTQTRAFSEPSRAAPRSFSSPAT